MRITQESDYALRMVYLLTLERGQTCDAADLSQRAGITQQFALKILRKLSRAGLICSVRGAGGGYRIAEPCENISMRDVIEAINGEIQLSQCLDGEYVCSRMGCRKGYCAFHRVFDAMSERLANSFAEIKIVDVLADEVSVEHILKKLN